MNAELLASIEREILGWPGVRKASSQGGAGRGGYRVPPFTSYTLGRREIGHIHDNGVADSRLRERSTTSWPPTAVPSRTALGSRAS
jgi:Family of unknown function (DUF5519)